jgi:hypothetical protein
VEELSRADRRTTIDSVATVSGCSHGLSYSICMVFWIFGKCAHGGCPENWRAKNNWTEWVCPCNISYGIQMKEKLCVTGLLLGMNYA